MSARKRKTTVASDLQGTHDSIQDVLVRIKADLSNTKLVDKSALIDELYRLSALAVTFTEQRHRSNKNWIHLADSVDREGVNLWNASGHISRGGDEEERRLLAALRLAGFRLIEAGLEQNPGIETLIHVLQLASKAGSALSAAERNDVAASVLGCAAKFEDQLRGAVDPSGLHQQSKTRAVMMYYSSRMEAAWREGNDAMAQFMLEKMPDMALVPATDRELLSAKILEIGKSILRDGAGEAVDEPSSGISNSSRAHTAVKWIQKAFAIAEPLEDAETPGVSELKRSILRSLARAYFLSSSQDTENLTRAEATLRELVTSIDESVDKDGPEYQQLRWMRLAVLKRQDAADPVLLDAFQSIVDHMSLTESNITDILQELRTLSQRHILVTAVNQSCLKRALESENEGFAFVDRLLLSLLFHCAKDRDHNRAIREVEVACGYVHDSAYELQKIPSTACLTLLWQFGGRLYDAKKWDQAADWFLAGTHQIFKSMAHTSSSKCFRKAALCYIQQREYARASTIIRRCPSNEATTHYVRFLAAAHQGLEEEAIMATQDMVNASDFDRKMLLLATQLCHEFEMKTLLLSVLGALLKTIRGISGIEAQIEAVTLVRCIIRLIQQLLDEPASHKAPLVDALLQHFVTAVAIVRSATKTTGAALIAKDVAWLWRTAYNIAIQGCSEWDDAERRVPDFFDISGELLGIYCQMAMVEVDAGVYLHLIYASFAALSARMLSFRQQMGTEDFELEPSILLKISADIDRCKSTIKDTLTTNQIQDESVVLRIQSFIHVIRVFEAEISCRRRDWDRLMQIIADTAQSDIPVLDTFEAIADILWDDKDCPTHVLYAALEAILHASLDRSSLSIEKFSRWLRAICTILLSRNTPQDRAKAVGYVEQAVSVLKDHSGPHHDDGDIYPLDERQWLLANAYNTGIECLHASLLDEARRWFECSTAVCRFVPDGETKAQKISETYSHLLDRYGR